MHQITEYKIRLEWDHVEGTDRYQILISDNEELAEAIWWIYPRKNHVYVRITPGKRYWWRVRSLDEKRNILTEFSKVQDFEVLPLEEGEHGNFLVLRPAKEVEPVPAAPEIASCPPSLKPSQPIATGRYSATVGLGANLVRIDQDIENVAALAFDSYQLPSQYLDFGYDLMPSWQLDAFFKAIPVRISHLDQQLDYIWTSLGLQNSHRVYTNSRNLNIYASWGLGESELPVVDIDGTSSEEQRVSMNTARIKFASAGGGLDYKFSDQFTMELWQSIQFPLSSKGEGGFSLSGGTFLAGEIMVNYSLSHDIYLGVAWSGQFQRFNFDFMAANGQIVGEQELFYASLDFRLGIEF